MPQTCVHVMHFNPTRKITPPGPNKKVVDSLFLLGRKFKSHNLAFPSYKINPKYEDCQ